jgi:hypothetical protein
MLMLLCWQVIAACVRGDGSESAVARLATTSTAYCFALNVDREARLQPVPQSSAHNGCVSSLRKSGRIFQGLVAAER